MSSVKLKKVVGRIPFVSYIYNKFYINMKKPYNYLIFVNDYRHYRKMSVNDNPRFDIKFKNRYPCLTDKTNSTEFDGHYVYHTAWAARVLSRMKPEKHIDISSYLYFNAIVSAFIPIEFYDYRPANLLLSNLQSKKADLLALPFKDKSIESISCMHTVEHIGLGRYGDPLNPDGDLIAIAELKRVLAMGGSLLFVVPIGKPKIMFNAHRIYSYEQISSYFSDLTLVEFTLIPDNATASGIIFNATKDMADSQNYACGCFWFRRDK